MKKYIINYLEKDDYDVLITLLDYKTQISRCLMSIKLSPKHNGKILIDTLLCSGMNEYRFIITTRNEDGTIDLNQCDYICVDNDVLKKANEIIKFQPTYLRNSILPEKQINNFLNGWIIILMFLLCLKVLMIMLMI